MVRARVAEHDPEMQELKELREWYLQQVKAAASITPALAAART